MNERRHGLLCSGLVKNYENVRALDGVSFDVDEGEVFGLLGPNGAGKSTCMKIFVGLVKADQGTALVENVDVSLRPLEAKKLVGFLPEYPMLFENLTGREFVTMMGMMRGMAKQDVDSRLEEFAKSLAIDEQMDALLGTYSKGMRQKISFTAAVIHDPPVLILDEPTSGLDPRFGRYIKNIIRTMGKEGHTVLLSTHITSVAEELCRRIAIIDHGSITAYGNVGDVVSSAGASNLEDAFISLVEDGNSEGG